MKKKTKDHIEIEFNLSATIIKIVVICIIIGVITGATVITTVMGAKKTDVLVSTEETSSRVTWVDSTELDENGKAKQVPVPKGFTASQIEGETTVSGGFVIYEGEVDWSQTIVDSAEESEVAETDTNETEVTILNITDEDTEEKFQTTLTSDELTETENVTTGISEITDQPATIDETAPVDEPAPVDETTPAATQTEINIFNLQKSTNQYVWVPIENPSEIYGVDANGKLWGKLYDFSSSGRSKNNWTETNRIMKITDATGYREPDVMDDVTRNDIDSQLLGYMSGQTRYELLTKEMEQNFYEMIKSIKQYGGFYIGRYETGGLNGTTVVRKMDTNISNQNWYTMYNKCQELGASNDNVKTSMIWGSLWDATLEWFVDSRATNSNGTQLTYYLVGTTSADWGNYYYTTFDYITSTATTPLETTTKAEETFTTIPTGSAEYTKVNNIYDIAGNIMEWTLETSNTGYRSYRSGIYTDTKYNYSADYRSNFDTNSRDYKIGCRVQLWIK